MNLEQRIQQAIAYIGSKTDIRPGIALVLGSGLGDYAERLEDPFVIPYDEIPGFPKSTVAGHAARLVFGRIKGKEVVIMQGRFHYYEGYCQDEITLPIRVLRVLGAEILLLTNAAGGIQQRFRPGDFMLISDHINFSGASPLRGPNLDTFGPRFVDMTHTYDKDLMERMREAAEQNGITLQEGVYMMFCGPQFETPAEIRFARTIGADAAGMSTVPEAIVARHAGMRIVGISLITNMAAGILDQPLTHQEVLETGAQASARFTSLIDAFLAKL